MVRRRREQLLLFLETLGLHLQTGSDLRVAWGRTLGALEASLGAVGSILTPSAGEDSLAAVLRRLARDYPEPDARLWFALLEELYGAGAALAGPVEAFAQSLRDARERDWEAFLRNLPVRINVLMLLFFFPAAAFLIAAPFLRPWLD